MEKHSTRATAEAETETHINAKGTGIQTKLKPHQERRGSDVIDSIGEASVFTERSTSKTLNIHVEFQSTQRRSSDVVDYIGDKHSEVNDKETKITEVDKAVGGAERPTTLDMKPTVSMEWNQEEQAWTSDDRSSKDVTDATPSTPLEANSSYKDDSR
ncbi:hypothetical protein L798_00181 [Zootermopsis nevadensis]|uniref:Uncharacterized protein n=1 Tax=Zootermopsis nevadensis TaxID=136037 RepID=A0A067RG60_ZOONE|nr:hypothetical protein L798_00181 [Zootermopsis nevadensis]